MKRETAMASALTALAAEAKESTERTLAALRELAPSADDRRRRDDILELLVRGLLVPVPAQPVATPPAAVAATATPQPEAHESEDEDEQDSE